LSVKHYFGAELRRFRVARRLSQAALGAATHVSADLIAKIEKAERWPARDFAERCDQALESEGVLVRLWPLVEQLRCEQLPEAVVPVQRTAAPPPPEFRPNPDPVSLAARKSRNLGSRLGTSNTTESVLECIDEEIWEVARIFLSAAPEEAFHRASDLHEQIIVLLQGRQPPSQISRLYALCAKCCALLAYLSEDMGYRDEAHSHARTAWVSAEESGDNGAIQWVRTVQSRLAYWAGHFKDSARFAADGLRWGGYADNINPLLALMEARAWASAGRREAAAAALDHWQNLVHNGAEPAHGYTVFHITMDRQINLMGVTHLWLGQREAALDQLQEAVKLLRQLPEDDLFTVSVPMNRVDSARAYVQNGELKGALRAVGPLLDQEGAGLAKMVRINAGYLRTELAAHSLYDTRPGRDLYSELATLT
jgi:transcriptional regulator with XRE-family HTH domain/tetratricopeptide (TPR) repeat protein